MIDLYYAQTPNGWKITIMLEECGLPYRVIPVNLGRGEQFSADFLSLSPNNRMPAIVDHDVDGDPLSLFESGAILICLAEKAGKFLPKDRWKYYETLQWLFWQVGGLGPMAGQASHYVNYAPEGNDYSKQRYLNEYDRLLAVMNRQLADHVYLAGEYSIADMAAFPWLLPYKRYGQDIDKFPHCAGGLIASRPVPLCAAAWMLARSGGQRRGKWMKKAGKFFSGRVQKMSINRISHDRAKSSHAKSRILL